jgi:hypothetical protein
MKTNECIAINSLFGCCLRNIVFNMHCHAGITSAAKIKNKGGITS